MSKPASPEGVKPLLRGWFHQVGFLVALLAGGILIGAAPAGREWVAAIYVGSLVTLLGTSALYHRPMWSARARARMRRLDHAAIFLLIAGTYTPICLLALGDKGQNVLIAAWVGAGLGMAQALLGLKVPRFILPMLYVGLGWLVAIALPDLLARTGPSALILIGLGGLAYTVGAVIYGFRWPNPKPAVFGYHEVFHLLVIAAAVCHFAAVEQILHTGELAPVGAPVAAGTVAQR